MLTENRSGINRLFLPSHVSRQHQHRHLNQIRIDMQRRRRIIRRNLRSALLRNQQPTPQRPDNKNCT